MNDLPPVAELLADAEYRGNTYRLLSTCFHVPDEELVTLLEDVATDDDLRLELDDLAAELPDDLEQLRVDYAKLFVGPQELLAPPYGSVHLEGQRQVMTESTMDVQRRYNEESLDVDLDEPADHVAAELEFLYYLVHREVEALEQSDVETAVEYLSKQREFLNRHLGQWIGAFAAEVTEHAETAFYRTLGEQTASFVEQDRERLRELPLETESAGGEE